MNKDIILPVEKYISISKAEEYYHKDDMLIRRKLSEERCRARIKLDRTIKYDKDVLDQVLAGTITTAEVPLYKRYVRVKTAERLYEMSRPTLARITAECGAVIKLEGTVFYDTWTIDQYLDSFRLW